MIAQLVFSERNKLNEVKDKVTCLAKKKYVRQILCSRHIYWLK